MPSLSVVICSHNPRPEYLRRTVEALVAQTQDRAEWELLLVDNASADHLATAFDLTWHPNSRHVREDKLGLTPARLRGIRESIGDLIIFVDDDNLLDAGYLETALKISSDFRQLGAFGAGRIIGEFETSPSMELVPHLRMLALRDETGAFWSNQQRWNSSIPFGAGLCVRKSVATAYAKVLETDEKRRGLDRSGESLLSCGDIDLALFACEVGLGTGVFPELSLKHLIPSQRLNRDYLVRLAEGHAMSHRILAELWGYQDAWKENSILGWIRHQKRLFGLKGIAKDIYQAERRGQQKASGWLLENR